MMIFLFKAGLWAKIIALVIFLLACLTDFLDGWLARRNHEISDFGKILDPVADKILILGTFICFVELQLIPSWMVIVIVIREFLITSVRLFAIRKGKVLSAENAGKHKTVFQMVAAFFILVFLVVREALAGSSFWNEVVQRNFVFCIFFLMGITLSLTIYSGLSFIWHNRKLIRSL
jgi:CDP-diacylglycerol--glycerol-3-phosphate 3-phosphatidyltransferase